MPLRHALARLRRDEPDKPGYLGALRNALARVARLEEAIRIVLKVTIDDPGPATVAAVRSLVSEADRLLPYYTGDEREELQQILDSLRARRELPPIAARPVRPESWTEVASATIALDNLLGSVPDVTAAVTELLRGGWTMRVDTVRQLAGQALQLWRTGQFRPAGETGAGRSGCPAETSRPTPSPA